MKVLKSFRDKEDNFKLYKKGKDKYTHKNKNRTEELVKLGYVEEVKEEPKKEGTKKKEEAKKAETK